MPKKVYSSCWHRYIQLKRSENILRLKLEYYRDSGVLNCNIHKLQAVRLVNISPTYEYLLRKPIHRVDLNIYSLI